MANLGYVGVSNLSQKMTKYYVGTDITYTPVEYLESTGSQYINTGVVPKSTTRMVLEFALSDTTVSTYNGFGAANSKEAFYCGASSSNFFSSVSANYVATNTNIALNTSKHTFDISNNAIIFDNVTYGTGTLGDTLSASNTLYLFALHAGWTAAPTFAKEKIYSCKIYDNDTLIRDYIPVLDNNNVPCLFDKISYQFWYNIGTTNFLYGTEGTTVTINNIARPVTKMYVGAANTFTPVEYIESSGTQFVDTGIVRDITKKYRLVASIKWNNTTTRQATGSQGYVYFGVVNGKYQVAQGGTTTTNVTATTTSFDNIDITFDCPNGTATGTINNTSIGTIAVTYSNEPRNIDIYIFSLNNLTLPSSCKVASFKIYENDTLVRDFVPMIGNDNEACFYDAIGGKIYSNVGIGSLTAGNTTSGDIITGSFSRKIKVVGETITPFASNIAPISWSGTTTTAGYEFSSSNTYGTWKVSSTLEATSTSYPSWKAVDGDNNSYINTNGLTTLTLTLPNNVSIQPMTITVKTQYCGRIQITGIEEKTGREFLLATNTTTTPSTALYINLPAENNTRYFTQFKVAELDRYGSNQVRLYTFSIGTGNVKVTGG